MNRTKRCPACATEKDAGEFGIDIARGGGLQSQCRACKKVIQNRWYRGNQARHIANVARRRRAVEAKIIRAIIAYLQQHPCVDCGEDNLVVLEFDHVKGSKRNAVSDLFRAGYSWETVYAEIQRCEVRCCNCHRIKTAKQFGYRKTLLSPAT